MPGRDLFADDPPKKKGRDLFAIPAASQRQGTPDFQNGGMDLVSDGGAQSQPKMSRMQSGYTGAQSGFAFGTADEQAGIKRLRADKMGRAGEAANFAARFIPGMGAVDAASGIIADMRGMEGSFREGINERRAVETQARTDNPVSYLAGEIVGSSVAPVGGSARAATKTAQIGKGMLAGAGSAGAYSFGATDGSLEERAKSGAIGAAGGAVFGGLLSAVIPRNIPLGDVLNAELFGTKVDRPVLKTIERMLVESGVSPNDIRRGVVEISQRLQSGDVSTGLPTRFKDELVKQFGDKARGVSEAIETQIRGGAARSGSASDAAVRAAVSEDNAAARELFSRSLDQFAGTASRPELRGQAIEQLGQIVEDQYKPILAQPIADPAKKQALVDVLNLPRMKSLAADLAEDAEREGIDLQQMIERNPAEAAHWMQSKARQLADDRGRVTASGRTMPDRTMTNRRADILAALEDAVPGYRETRMEFGDKVGVTQAINFAKGFLSRAKDDVAVADMAEEFAGMSQAQQQMAVASMRSLLQGSAENVRYVDPEVATSALRTAEIAKEPVLRALSDVFGEQGTKLADDIKAIVSRTDANRRINPQATGSDTVPKAEAIKFATRNTRGPLQRGIGAIFGGLPLDVTASTLAGVPAPITASRAGIQGVGKMADKRALSTVDKVTELLLARPQNALAPNNPPRGGVPPVGGGSIVDRIGQEAQAAPQGVNALARNEAGFMRPDAAGTMMTAGGAGIGAMNPIDFDGDGKTSAKERAMTAALYGGGAYAANRGVHGLDRLGRAPKGAATEFRVRPGESGSSKIQFRAGGERWADIPTGFGSEAEATAQMQRLQAGKPLQADVLYGPPKDEFEAMFRSWFEQTQGRTAPRFAEAVRNNNGLVGKALWEMDPSGETFARYLQKYNPEEWAQYMGPGGGADGKSFDEALGRVIDNLGNEVDSMTRPSGAKAGRDFNLETWKGKNTQPGRPLRTQFLTKPETMEDVQAGLMMLQGNKDPVEVADFLGMKYDRSAITRKDALGQKVRDRIEQERIEALQLIRERYRELKPLNVNDFKDPGDRPVSKTFNLETWNPNKPKSSGPAMFRHDLANAAVGGTVGGMGGSFSGEFTDYNGDGVIDETDKQIGFLIGTGLGAFGAPIGTRFGTPGNKFTRGAGPSGKPPKLMPDVPRGTRKPGQKPNISGTIQRGQEQSSSVPIAKAIGGEGLAYRTAKREAEDMMARNVDLEEIQRRTGLVPISYRGQMVWRGVDGEVTAYEANELFYEALKLPPAERPDWVKQVLDEIGPKVEPLNLGGKDAPLRLGGPNTPMRNNTAPNNVPRNALLGGLGAVGVGTAYYMSRDPKERQNAFARPK